MEENNNVNVTVEEPKKPKKKAPILTIILIIIIIGLLGLLGYTNKDKLFDKKEPAKTEEKKTNEKNNNNSNNSNNNNNNSKSNEPTESERNEKIFANIDKALDINNTPFKVEYSGQDEYEHYTSSKIYFNNKLIYDSADDELVKTIGSIYELNYNGTIYYAYELDANLAFPELKIVDQNGNIIYSKNLWTGECGGMIIAGTTNNTSYGFDVSNKKLYIYEAPKNIDDELNFAANRIKVEISPDNTVKLDRENQQEFDASIGMEYC